MSERKEDCEVRTLIALAVGVGFGVIIGAAALAVAYPVFNSKDWAAWVQAFGSVAAIFVAIWVSARQATASRTAQEAEWSMQSKERNKARLDTLKTIETTVSTSAKVYLKAATDFVSIKKVGPNKTRAQINSMMPVLSMAEAVANNVSVCDFPSVLLIEPVLNVRLYMGRMNKVFNKIIENVGADFSADLVKMDKYVEKMEENLIRIKQFNDSYDGGFDVKT